jgi:glycosyltransferase involved in cell wall biosynthesis
VIYDTNPMTIPTTNSARVSAIVPARNEEAAIAGCVESLARQPEITEILVVDDHSTDRTAAIVNELKRTHGNVRLLPATELPQGWVGKNHAVWQGAQEANGEWLLFTDADAEHNQDSAKQALEIAQRESSVMASFSPQQVLESWYEKALIPYVYCRLASRFSYDAINDPRKTDAAANGQFLLIRRDVYQAVGGHGSVAADVLEDVALAKRIKSAGYRIWFGSGKGIVRVRMYRTFAGMHEGWKKNLYPLMGGDAQGLGREYFRAIGPVLATIVAAISTWGLTGSWLAAIGILLAGIVATSVAYADELRRNGFSHRLVSYGLPGRLFFAEVLWASYRAHKQGKLRWKGREYPVGTSRASNG